MKVKELVKKYGGQTALADLLGVGQSAIAYWVKKESVPTKWHNRLLSIANEKGIDIFAADLIAVELSGTNESAEQAKNTISNTTPFSAGTASVLSNDFSEGAQHFLFYASENGTIKVQVFLGDDTVWATQRGISDIFDTTRENITIHLKNVFDSNELDEKAVCKESLLTAADGKRYPTKQRSKSTRLNSSHVVTSRMPSSA